MRWDLHVCKNLIFPKRYRAHQSECACDSVWHEVVSGCNLHVLFISRAALASSALIDLAVMVRGKMLFIRIQCRSRCALCCFCLHRARTLTWSGWSEEIIRVGVSSMAGLVFMHEQLISRPSACGNGRTQKDSWFVASFFVRAHMALIGQLKRGWNWHTLLVPMEKYTFLSVAPC